MNVVARGVDLDFFGTQRVFPPAPSGGWCHRIDALQAARPRGVLPRVRAGSVLGLRWAGRWTACVRPTEDFSRRPILRLGHRVPAHSDPPDRRGALLHANTARSTGHGCECQQRGIGLSRGALWCSCAGALVASARGKRLFRRLVRSQALARCIVVLRPGQLYWVRHSAASWSANRVRPTPLCFHSLRPLRIAASPIRIVHCAGALQYKFVVLQPCGHVRWEDDRPNRCLDTIEMEAQSLKRGEVAQARAARSCLDYLEAGSACVGGSLIPWGLEGLPARPSQASGPAKEGTADGREAAG